MPETTYTTASGRAYVVTTGLAGRGWGTFERKANGNYRRLASPRLPMRDTYQEALEDFRAWVELQVDWFEGTGRSRQEWQPVYDALCAERAHTMPSQGA